MIEARARPANEENRLSTCGFGMYCQTYLRIQKK